MHSAHPGPGGRAWRIRRRRSAWRKARMPSHTCCTQARRYLTRAHRCLHFFPAKHRRCMCLKQSLQAGVAEKLGLHHGHPCFLQTCIPLILRHLASKRLLEPQAASWPFAGCFSQRRLPNITATLLFPLRRVEGGSEGGSVASRRERKPRSSRKSFVDISSLLSLAVILKTKTHIPDSFSTNK